LLQSIGVDGEVNEDEEVTVIAAVAPADDVKPIPKPPLELAIGDESSTMNILTLLEIQGASESKG
jgi:hypothetical protein